MDANDTTKAKRQTIEFPPDVAGAIEQFQKEDLRPSFQNAVVAAAIRGIAAWRQEKAGNSAA